MRKHKIMFLILIAIKCSASDIHDYFEPDITFGISTNQLYATQKKLMYDRDKNGISMYIYAPERTNSSLMAYAYYFKTNYLCGIARESFIFKNRQASVDTNITTSVYNCLTNTWQFLTNASILKPVSYGSSIVTNYAASIWINPTNTSEGAIYFANSYLFEIIIYKTNYLTINNFYKTL